MNKLFFEDIHKFDVNRNLLFLSRSSSFECFDLIADKQLFTIGNKFWIFIIVNDKIIGQIKDESDLLVYDFGGKLLQTFSGRFYLWKFVCDNSLLFVPGLNEKDEFLCFKINVQTLNIIDKIENYKTPVFIKDTSGFGWVRSTVYCRNVYTNNNIWSYDLGAGVKGEHDYCYLNDEVLIVTTSDARLISLRTESGECLWQKETTLKYYTMHPVNKNLYGFSTKGYEIISSKTGELMVSKEFKEINELFQNDIVSSMSRVTEEGLFFIKLMGDKKVGKINIVNHELEFVIDLDIPRSMRLEVAMPYGDRYFVKDADQNLHVYQKD